MNMLVKSHFLQIPIKIRKRYGMINVGTLNGPSYNTSLENATLELD